MKRISLISIAFAAMLGPSCLIGTGLGGSIPGGRIIDHEDATIDGITAARIADAKADLVVAYWHTSHGSQLVEGISGMDEFYASRGWSVGTFTLNGGTGLRLFDGPEDVDEDDENDAYDLGNPNRTNFIGATRRYLDAYPEVNVVMWSWCGQADTEDAADIELYLNGMSTLEAEYPEVVFVYMTGHAVGSGEEGDLHLRDQQIRDYCVANNKWLFDFYDIECYDPDDVYYGDRYVTDGCNYDYNNSGETTQAGDPAEPTGGDRNWASDWQIANPGEWWDCGSAHSKALNANRKARAVWQLWCAIAAEM